ncbi:Putative transcriptional regulator [Flavobacterium indicum GPTSA100-9 = DSM 17447]|uniref:Type III pantothenate kinase n=1 Tax=Flavobacterium indicum (strain DSM 17447 / CIP 109464 / GPTSA100-9) TaxID=1094466 RepID=H8XRC0_FLAIG|nr:type III pantothenate kinase [Flavobacterium indicum]CCG54354.1 Putative transcriptional regulator [Flavobacterium indicum GPTSA100-9 = DSM 17447]
MILTVDIGNTFIKVAVFEEVELVEKFVFTTEEVEKKILKIFKKYPNLSAAIYSSVGKKSDLLDESISKHVKITKIDAGFNFPFINKYETPKTLGVDRMVLASGATLAFANKNCLVIDAGTCVTYDFISDQNEYLGGAISLGIRLRYESLHNFTAKLPLLEKKNPDHYIGKNTNEAIHSGVIIGLLNEIEGFISKYSVNYQDLTVILTGGDANFLANQLKSTIFADENFLLKSLQQLHSYSLQND